MKKINIIDLCLRKYMRMSKRELSHSIQSNLWFTPMVYVCLSILLVLGTLTLDLHYKLGNMMRTFFAIDYHLSLTLVSTLTAAILSLTTFTFNLILVVFTTFSGQFSPRMLKNFISSKATQRVLGIFNGSFFYMILTFLFLNQRIATYYFAMPVVATCLAIVSIATFVFFINHAVSWLQVNKMTDNMKRESLNIVKSSLQNELEPHRLTEGTVINFEETSDGQEILAGTAGYIQLVDFVTMIKQAKQDDIVIKFRYTIGSYVFATTPIFTYWKNGKEIDKEKYVALISIGKKQTEVQDIEFSLNKLVEVAIRSLGNADPKTATNAIYHIGELLVSISQNVHFTPYLIDDKQDIRVLLHQQDFSNFLYDGLGYIRYYAKDNDVILLELLSVLNLMSKSINRRDHTELWNFAEVIVEGIQSLVFPVEQDRFNRLLFELAQTTNHVEAYEAFTRKYSESREFLTQL